MKLYYSLYSLQSKINILLTSKEYFAFCPSNARRVHAFVLLNLAYLAGKKMVYKRVLTQSEKAKHLRQQRASNT